MSENKKELSEEEYLKKPYTGTTIEEFESE